MIRDAIDMAGEHVHAFGQHHHVTVEEVDALVEAIDAVGEAVDAAVEAFQIIPNLPQVPNVVQCAMIRMRALLVFAVGVLGVLGGCAASTPTPTPVYRVLVGGEMNGRKPQPPAERVDSCKPSRAVIVVDASGRPIEGARIAVEQRVSEHAIEETLAVWAYRAEPAATDAQGHALICEPSELLPRPRQTPSSFPMEGIGGGFTDRGLGEIVVTAGNLKAMLEPPFQGHVRVVLRP